MNTQLNLTEAESNADVLILIPETVEDEFESYRTGDLADQFEMLVEDEGLSEEEAANMLDNGAYQGQFDSEIQFVQNQIEELYGDVVKSLPNILKSNIDYRSILNDFKLSGEFSFIRSGKFVHVFDNFVV